MDKNYYEMLMRKNKSDKDDLHWRMRLNDEVHHGTIRAQRARRTTDAIMGVMNDFIPYSCRDQAHEHIMSKVFQANVELIEVPPECDEMDKKELERRRLELSMTPIKSIFQKNMGDE